MWFRALENECRLANPPPARKSEFADAERIEIRMFRVVEGEAILLIFDQTRCWLIDGGNTGEDEPNETLAEALHTYLLHRNLTLEVCVASHAHFDQWLRNTVGGFLWLSYERRPPFGSACYPTKTDGRPDECRECHEPAVMRCAPRSGARRPLMF